LHTIRPEQFAVFAQADLQRYEDWVLAHVRHFFPEQANRAGAENLRETTRHAIQRAATYEIRSKRDVCKYADLAVILGRDFDTDSRLPWAGDILRKALDSEIKMKSLCQAAAVYLRPRNP